ncbi:MAG: signal peptidase II [Phycisphaerales bacterium]
MSDRSEPGSAAVPETVVPAFRSAWAWLILLTVLALGLSVDLGLKQWSFENLANEPVILDRKQLLHDPYWRIPHHESFTLIPRVLELHLVENRGAVFGIGVDQRIFFIVFTVGALMAAIVVFARWTTNQSHMAHLGLGLILAGGIGNLYDRVQFGVVRDFVHLFPGWVLPFGWRWRGESNEVFPWVFNMADVMLLVGMGMLMLHLNRRDRQRRAARTLAAKQADDQTQPESA